MRCRTFLAFGCVHRPFHDPEAVNWLVEQIRDRQPDVLVCLGDLFDANCLGAFEDNDTTTLEQEYDSTSELLAQIRDAHPKAKQRVWLSGNHEQRMFRLVHERVAGVLDYKKRIAEAKRWKHFEYIYSPKHCFSIGQLTFYHGFETGRQKVKSESVKLGVPFGCTISAHTHRPFPVHRISWGVTPLPFWHLNVGTLMKEGIRYMEQKDDSLWGQGCAVGWSDTRRRYCGRQHWKAELLLRKMFWEDVGEGGAP